MCKAGSHVWFKSKSSASDAHEMEDKEIEKEKASNLKPCAIPRANIESHKKGLLENPKSQGKHSHAIGWGCIEGDCSAHVATVSIRTDEAPQQPFIFRSYEVTSRKALDLNAK